MKVGDYYRTEYGINKLREDVCILDDIIKSSPNIIDLIEVGDYVNGQQVCLIDDEYIVDDEIKTVFFTNKNYSFAMFEEDIKSIVTKEQFKSMEYKVGELA